MSPRPLIDVSRMYNPIHTPIARDDGRADQVKALVVGTLLFLPFLVGYFALCANQ